MKIAATQKNLLPHLTKNISKYIFYIPIMYELNECIWWCFYLMFLNKAVYVSFKTIHINYQGHLVEKIKYEKQGDAEDPL
jgi:hypothetical protein